MDKLHSSRGPPADDDEIRDDVTADTGSTDGTVEKRPVQRPARIPELNDEGAYRDLARITIDNSERFAARTDSGPRRSVASRPERSRWVIAVLAILAAVVLIGLIYYLEFAGG